MTHPCAPCSIPPASAEGKREKVILKLWQPPPSKNKKPWMYPHSPFLTAVARVGPSKRGRWGGRECGWLHPRASLSLIPLFPGCCATGGMDSWDESHGSVVKLTGKSDPLCFSFTVSFAHSLSPFISTCYQNHVCVCVCCEVLEGHRGHRGARENEYEDYSGERSRVRGCKRSSDAWWRWFVVNTRLID